MTKITKILTVFFLCLADLFFPATIIYASTYNSGTYGGGVYNTGDSTSTDSTSTTSTSSSSSSSGTSCSAQAPGGSAVKLYAALAESSSKVTVYFTDASEPYEKYTLFYGIVSQKYIYSAQTIPKKTRAFTVQDLSPNTTYYFRIMPLNGCAPGELSNEISATTTISSGQSFTGTSITASFDEGDQTKKEATEMPKGGDLRHTVVVEVTNTQKKPVAGAKLTLYSTIKKAATDKQGKATFVDVEPGEHTLAVVYGGFKGERKIYLGNHQGGVYNINLEIAYQNPWYINAWYIGIGALGMLLFLLFLFHIYTKKQNKTLQKDKKRIFQKKVTKLKQNALLR